MKSIIHRLTKARLSLYFCVLASIGIWVVFYPGVFSADSIGFIYSATHAKYFDLQPPLIPLVLKIVLSTGGNIELVTLLQAVAGMFGVRQLVLELVKFSGISEDVKRDSLAFTVLVLLSTPLTPFSIYLVTLWTDTWLFIFLIWAIAIVLDIYQRPQSPNQTVSIFRVAILTGLLGAAMLVRYNSLVLTPVLILATERALAHAGARRRSRVTMALAPLLVVLVFRIYQARFLQVESDHPEHVVYALDLASMILQDPTICFDLSLKSCEMVQEVFPPGFIVGNGAIDNTYNQGRGTASQAFLDLVHYPGLPDELSQEVREHPLFWVSVKLSNYFDYLRPDSSRFFYPERMIGNNFGLSYSAAYEGGRITWFSITDWVAQNPLLRWFSFVHSVWLIINILGMAICIFWMWRKQDKDAGFLTLILLIPLVYYGSYLLAMTASDFRFMYPSTVIVQVISMSIGFSFLLPKSGGCPGTNKFCR